MRIDDVRSTVAAMGLIARWKYELSEWQVDYRRTDPRWTPDSTYFTNDALDAIGTARQMAAWRPDHDGESDTVTGRHADLVE